MYGHGIHRFNIIEPAWQDKTDTALPVITRERHPQYMAPGLTFTLGKHEGDANIAVHQPQPVIVAGHQHRAAFVPLLIAINQLAGKQGAGDALIQALHAPRPLAHGAEHLKGLERLQHMPRPGRPARVFKAAAGVRALLAQPLNIMPIAFGLSATPFQRQTFKGAVLLALEGQRKKIGMIACRQQGACLAGQLLVDQARQLANTAALTKAPRVAQHDHLLGQRVRTVQVLLQVAGTKVFATDLLQPATGLRGIPARLGIPAQIPQYGTGFNRRQLILVTQQHQPRMGWQGIEQIGHHFQVNHRRFVDHQHVQRQTITRVMAKVSGTGAAAQQPVNSGHVTGDFLPNLVVHFQGFDLHADGLGQPGGGFAGRCCQTNAQGCARLHRRGLQQSQQAHHGRGFTGAGAARDDAESPACSQSTRQFLPVNRRILCRATEQAVQTYGQIRRGGFSHCQTLAQSAVDSTLISPVTAQIQTSLTQHQGPAGRIRRRLPGMFDQ